MNTPRTGLQIQSDIYELVKASGIAKVISGDIYRGGLRPRGSNVEDLIVIFTEADGEQVQGGTVTLNLYVPDLGPYDNGVMVQDLLRCGQLEEALQALVRDWFNLSHGAYYFSLREAIHTNHDDEIKQSFVVARIRFKVFGAGKEILLDDSARIVNTEAGAKINVKADYFTR